MIEVNRKGEVWVFAEQEDGRLSDVPLELMSKGRELAETAGRAAGGGAAGRRTSPRWPSELIAHGADKVYLVEDDRLGHYQTAGYGKVICDLIAAAQAADRALRRHADRARPGPHGRQRR